jgi:hypothetical protein
MDPTAIGVILKRFPELKPLFDHSPPCDFYPATIKWYPLVKNSKYKHPRFRVTRWKFMNGTSKKHGKEQYFLYRGVTECPVLYHVISWYNGFENGPEIEYDPDTEVTTRFLNWTPGPTIRGHQRHSRKNGTEEIYSEHEIHIIPWDQGELHGKETIVHRASGILLYERNWRHGERHGVVARYNAKGQRIFLLYYNMNLMEGDQIWYKKDLLWRKVCYARGMRHGWEHNGTKASVLWEWGYKT